MDRDARKDVLLQFLLSSMGAVDSVRFALTRHAPDMASSLLQCPFVMNACDIVKIFDTACFSREWAVAEKLIHAYPLWLSGAALTNAAQVGSLSVVRRMRALPCVQWSDVVTSATMAARAGRLSVVKTLFWGTACHRRSLHGSQLLVACQVAATINIQLHVCEWLHRKGAPVTPSVLLSYSVAAGRLDGCKAAVEVYGAVPTELDVSSACSGAHIDVCAYLLNCFPADRVNESMLFSALNSSCPDIASTLLSRFDVGSMSGVCATYAACLAMQYPGFRLGVTQDAVSAGGDVVVLAQHAIAYEAIEVLDWLLRARRDKMAESARDLFKKAYEIKPAVCDWLLASGAYTHFQ